MSTDQLATEVALIRKIARRAMDTIPALRAHGVLSIDIQADIAACHYRGCPLRLAALLTTDELSFARDVGGILRGLDRATGQLNGFAPRFAGLRLKFAPVAKDNTFAERKRRQRARERQAATERAATERAAASALSQGG